MSDPSQLEHQQPESSINTENDTSWLIDFHNVIQSRLNASENYQFQWCEVRYEENKISNQKLREQIESLLAPYPDLVTKFRELMSSMLADTSKSVTFENDRSKDEPDYHLSLQIQNSPSIFNLFRSKNPDYIAMTDFIVSNPGLVCQRNQAGQFPLHVACIKGYPYTVILALVENYPEALTMADNAGRLPLHHYVTVHSVYAWRDSAIISFPQQYNQDKYVADLSVDAINLLGAKHLILQEDNFGFCPLTCLALECHFMDPSNEQNVQNAKQILDTMIDFDPPFSSYLFKKIRTFPSIFVQRAANHKFIKQKLNLAASSSFLFFATVILDLAMRITIIYAYANIPSLKSRFREVKTVDTYNFSLLYLGISYLGASMFVRIRAFTEVRNTIDWTKSGWNWLQLIEFLLVSISTIGLHTAPKRDHSVSTTLAAGIQWLSLLVVLRPASHHFVRFWSGILNVLRVLFPFFITLSIFIVGFVFMLHFSFKYSDCKDIGYCDRSLFEIIYKIVTDSINGEIQEVPGGNSFVTSITFLYGVFVLLLLLNILIAVVIDAYSNNDGDETFWFERLIHVSEIEIVFSCRNIVEKWTFSSELRAKLEYNWELFWQFLFQPKRLSLHTAKQRGYKEKKTTRKRIKHGICRFLGLIVGLPLWLLVGFLSLGWLLPPQVKSILLDGQIGEDPVEDTRLEDSVEALKESISKQMRQLEKRQNKKLSKLQSELETLRSNEDRLKVVEDSLHKLDLILDCLKKEN